jgi:hypothetical protein
MADWSIKIVPAASGSGAAFQPDLQGYGPGDALPAQQDDLVTWNNTTREVHQPWPTDSKYQPLSDVWVTKDRPSLYLSNAIPGGQPSTPAYDVATPGGVSLPSSWTIYYYCKTHPTRQSERGTIKATVQPAS